MFHPHTILHPTDFSADSRYALHVAADLARSYNAELVILHVYSQPVALYAEGALPPPVEYPESLERELRQFNVPGVRTSHQLVEGDPVSEILRVAQERHADLIVMGTHGRRGLRRMLMGSVAELVVRRSPQPVLTLRMPAEAVVDEPAVTGAPEYAQ